MELSTPLPPELNCRLCVKSGEALTPCRDKVPGHNFTFLVADGYDILLAHIKRVFGTTVGLMWDDFLSVYVKGTNHAPQKDYILVPTDSAEMKTQFTAIWYKARLRKHGHAAFVLELFVYVRLPRAQRLTSHRRATDNRIQEQLPRVATYMQEHINGLRKARGHPPYSLRPPYRSSPELDVPDPTVDIADAKHALDAQI
ncbi:hypothetical protein PHMEG_00013214 [Phytophthora megakarya]|uniref:Uncharacterized protein n=1 Tax=Phytophthora megakarya TaxID=4795 RepID=A0A225W6U7_9STRA|nr:hypothetical protein PHMEG_00013214 [Phytophthora megakarya]